ncbi:cell division ATP-binding protein FtsE [Liquorilactobacillus oeni]|uniref:Cell division ATP-binding protein FtsE n=2 Tax=Liquorilactobacillus oeni TaxID=303241 RepID=A0A0R1MB85_9LACO|nr:ATP-binding cassette domain-containing protein [Liquorilactobacillus oeni]AJA34189.1 cell division protein FtsE [Liquorilactobacillus oeni]KRL05495.1 cell division ATP-binding protein FtsE [Liquorilactobacillus oeni DSM 19972]
MISLRNVSKEFNSKNMALTGINFDAKQGEFIYVVGPSGAGKSTLLKLLCREEQLTGGSIIMGNTRLEKIKTRSLYKLRRQLGIVLQTDLFIPYYSVFENIRYCLEAVGSGTFADEKRVQAVLKEVGMAEYKDSYLNELSIGQQKKVAIARAIINNPPIILADEPTANLDAKSALEIMKLFFKINRTKTTVIMATHDSTMVNTVRRRVLELQNGYLIRDEENGGFSSIADPKDVYIW